MNISLCSIEDLDIYAETLRTAYIASYLYLWKNDGNEYIERSFNNGQILKEFQNPSSNLYLLKEQSSPVGILKLNMEKDRDGNKKPCIEIERLYMLPTHAGKNYGRQAIHFVIELAKQKKYAHIWLHAMDTSPAIDFYIKNGFVQVGTKNLTYPELHEDKRGMWVMEYNVNLRNKKSNF